MSKGDDLLATIEAVHAAGLDAGLWPEALARVTHLVGGRSASVEIVDRATLRHREYHAFGVPPATQLDYLDQYAAINPRVPFVASRLKSGDLVWDYQILDEGEIDRSPFYTEFLDRIDMRYFVSATLVANNELFAGLCVHRSRKQGHAERANISTIKLLGPHVRQALDVAARIKGSAHAATSLERALDWLVDGVALLRSDGHVEYANESLQAMTRRGDGIRIRKGAIELSSPDARAHLTRWLADIARAPSSAAMRVADFPVERGSGTLPYLAALRPLGKDERLSSADARAVAILFVRDPTHQNKAAALVLRQVFGLTEAEASVALALQKGSSLPDYARRSGVSVNTVYTHLRRLKEKTGCSRMGELIRKLNDLQVPLRS